MLLATCVTGSGRLALMVRAGLTDHSSTMPVTNLAGADAAQTARLATLGRLTRGALHELGNPLVALIGTAELATAAAEPGSRHRERLDLIGAMANEIGDVVRVLQRVARVGAAEGKERVELSAETAAALVLVQRLIPGRPSELEGSYPIDAVVVKTSPGALLVALVALVLDTLDSAPPGPIRLAVSQDGASASVRVMGARAGEEARVLAASAGATLEESDGGITLVLALGG